MASSDHARTEAAILRANAAFYRAFSQGDHVSMGELWALQAPVTCFHPLAPVLVGRRAVLASWRDILREAPPFELRCDRPMVHVFDGMAIVTCYEGNADHPAHLAATNVFVLEGGHWRMVHHQAGPLSEPVPRSVPPSAVN